MNKKSIVESWKEKSIIFSHVKVMGNLPLTRMFQGYEYRTLIIYNWLKTECILQLKNIYLKSEWEVKKEK